MGLVPLFDLGLNDEDQLCGTRRRDSGGRYHELSPIERLIYSDPLLTHVYPFNFRSLIFKSVDIGQVHQTSCQTMSVKQLLLAALTGTLLIHSVSSQISCNGRLDHECCKGKNKQQCSFEELETEFKGACLDIKVSLLVDRSRFVASYILLVATVCEHRQLTSLLSWM
jgi:hypothetical protein